jgi:hypothetical protein
VQSWNESNFDELSWHDNRVHGISICGGQYNEGELVLDIDFIVEWLCGVDRTCRFRLAPAVLTFHGVFDLLINLDYASAGAGTVPFSIDHIEREPITFPNGASGARWRICANWPPGLISFANQRGFTQVLRADPIETDEQYLQPSQRRGGISGV